MPRAKSFNAPGELNTGKAAAGDDEHEQGLTLSCIWRVAGALECVDDLVADHHRVGQRFEVERGVGTPVRPRKLETEPRARTRWSKASVRTEAPASAVTSRRRWSRSMRSTWPRITSVRRNAERSGLLMCVGSRVLPATSASIGVNNSAVVSLTRVSEIDRSAPTACSR